MDPNLHAIQEFTFEHRHDDGSWERLEQVEPDPAASDPDRSWTRGRIFRCRSCSEMVRVSVPQRDEVDDGPLS